MLCASIFYTLIMSQWKCYLSYGNLKEHTWHDLKTKEIDGIMLLSVWMLYFMFAWVMHWRVSYSKKKEPHSWTSSETIFECVWQELAVKCRLHVQPFRSLCPWLFKPNWALSFNQLGQATESVFSNELSWEHRGLNAKGEAKSDLTTFKLIQLDLNNIAWIWPQ